MRSLNVLAGEEAIGPETWPEEAGGPPAQPERSDPGGKHARKHVNKHSKCFIQQPKHHPKLPSAIYTDSTVTVDAPK